MMKHLEVNCMISSSSALTSTGFWDLHWLLSCPAWPSINDHEIARQRAVGQGQHDAVPCPANDQSKRGKEEWRKGEGGGHYLLCALYTLYGASVKEEEFIHARCTCSSAPLLVLTCTQPQEAGKQNFTVGCCTHCQAVIHRGLMSALPHCWVRA